MIAAAGVGWRRAPETIQHVISGCPALAPVEYKHRHDQVAKIIHQELGVKYGLLKDKVPYYQYAPASVLQGKDQTLYWDRSVLTGRRGIIGRTFWSTTHHSNEVVFVDIAVPCTHNLQSTHNEKISKYAELGQVVKEQWKVCLLYTSPSPRD